MEHWSTRWTVIIVAVLALIVWIMGYANDVKESRKQTEILKKQTAILEKLDRASPEDVLKKLQEWESDELKVTPKEVIAEVRELKAMMMRHVKE